MKINDYLAKRKLFLESVTQPRESCSQCGFSLKTCYCSQIIKFDPKITFVILIHQLEIDRKIATGRMASLILENSLLVRGHDYSENVIINKLVSDPKKQCFILFPGEKSLNLSLLSYEEKMKVFSSDKEMVVFVVDGTWATARQTMRLSKNLNALPRISFTPSRKSNFKVRKQPKGECLSTIEAIHETIELLGETKNFNTQNRDHDNLLHVFNCMVEKQLGFFVQDAMMNSKRVQHD